MMRAWFILLVFLLHEFAHAQTQLAVIPRPREIKATGGSFTITKRTAIVSDKHSLKEAKHFGTLIAKYYGIELKLKLSGRPLDNSINIFKTENELPANAYKIFSGTYSILLMGKDDAVFHGIQTLSQMAQYDSVHKKLTVPGMHIYDYPRFAWRGMHLDVVRHFYPVDVVKRYIDHLARYKMNVFHWHLTDDQGWRIEIKKYPRLTQVGAWRKGSQYGRYSDMTIDSIRYGGFYTQKEIQDVVEYAANRHIKVVPEIEMPGHALAALAAYPAFACKTDTTYAVSETWGVFEDVFCPKDETFKFLEDVLSEVMALFPSTYIHIGGDECPKARWKACQHCQSLMKREGLKDEHELQSYFIQRIEKFVNGRGKKIIGWDEILEGGLAPNAAVMSWRGIEGGRAAARMGHEVVMSPGTHCYFDHYQWKPDSLEPIAIGGFTPVEKVYAYEPVPDSLTTAEARLVMGAQGNVWTEYIATRDHLEYMALPRMCALAEALWLDPAGKSYNDFRERFKKHANLLNKLKVKYAKHILSDKE